MKGSCVFYMPLKVDKKNKALSISENEFGDIDIDLYGELPLRPSDERTNELYEKFEYANKMYKDRNYDNNYPLRRTGF